jgi:hypothetical protein
MRRSTCAAALALTALFSACTDGGPTTAPAAAGSRPLAVTKGGESADRLINMKDACDAETFNAVLGPGSCVRRGGVTFAKFIEELTKHGRAGAWHFAPPQTDAKEGQTLLAINRGGEVHTFTHVAHYGGGIVPLLNTLSHNPVIAPECAHLEGDDFVPPGGVYKEEEPLEPGEQRFQCCIHPWMRTTVRVKGS